MKTDEQLRAEATVTEIKKELEARSEAVALQMEVVANAKKALKKEHEHLRIFKEAQSLAAKRLKHELKALINRFHAREDHDPGARGMNIYNPVMNMHSKLYGHYVQTKGTTNTPTK
jgi:outer membrane lipopolysaccharide assembly protein LptE/RlpB